MRSLTATLSLLMFSALAFGQSAEHGIPGYCPYGCGPFIPMVTTPVVSFTTVSPNPAGATNATGGLIAGASNSTLSQPNGNPDAVYTEPVWNSGGGVPLISRAVNLPFGSMRMMRRQPTQPAPREPEASARQPWTYFASPEESIRSLERASAEKGVRPAQKSYSNADVERQNEKNGAVHYDGKTEKIQ